MSLALRRPPALRHRNFRLFYGGQFVSLIGTWMQMAAQSWLVYSLTGSAEKLGYVSVVQAVPGMLMTAWGGVIADRCSKRSILLVTQSAAMVLAFILYWLVHHGVVQYRDIVLLAFLLGFVNAVDMPTRGAFVIELVGREDVHSAVALNSSIFNASRIVGPAVTGLIVDHWGTGMCFLVNGLSFLAPIIGLLLLRLPTREATPDRASPLQQLAEGLRFIRGHEAVRGLVVLMATSSVLLWGTGVLLPVFAGDVLKAGPQAYGFLMASGAVGAVIGALMTSMSEPSRTEGWMQPRVLGGVLGYCMASMLFAWTRWLPMSLALQVAGGFASILYFSTSNSSLQVLVPDEMRGRVFGVYHTMFQGFMPLGSFIVAWTAQRLGAPLALTIMCGLGILLVAVMAAWRGGKTRVGLSDDPGSRARPSR